jgi:hypothetical protein
VLHPQDLLSEPDFIATMIQFVDLRLRHDGLVAAKKIAGAEKENAVETRLCQAIAAIGSVDS